MQTTARVARDTPSSPPPQAAAGLAPALGLALAPLVALGFSRFAYALLLPAMQQEFGWSFAQAGSLNTANAAGYLVGALLAAPLAAKLGALRSFGLSMGLSALALAATALWSWLPLLLAVRFVGGVATALAFVLGSAFAARVWPGRSAMALALYFAGSGSGIVIAGTLLPLAAGGPQGLDWRSSWLVMAGLAGAATWLAIRAARAVPARVEAPAGGARPAPAIWRLLAPSLLANLLFGAGYVGYMTFVIALLHGQGLPPATTLGFFALLGGASMAASLAWGPALSRLPLGRGFALVCTAVALGMLPLLVSPTPLAALASALLFGASFMAGPAAVSMVAQRLLPAPALTWGLSLLTAAFSLGQSLGPLLAGALSDATGSLAAGLWLGPLLLLAAAAVSLRQAPRAPLS
ncbi:YbfB/YjiJ family MFS transporter [Ramlibacter sp. 2FC]|uniref:YbfB/YjiJ family MFS transporter n=1 Tax=Ramlibacter sp. 2FC TaxID=2502188 RepID=UPI00148572AE|nr:YbfB/YjiJ family MFS transporter [Ramlibacter sp. 2FC]